MQSYDPTNVNVSYNKVPVSGFGPGAFIKASRNEETWTLQIGNSGTGARNRNPNKSGKIEITVKKSAPVNALLSAIAVTDEQSAQGVGPFLVKDRNTNSALCEAQNAWITKIPDWERGKEDDEVTWVLETDVLTINHDGVIDQ